VVVGGGVPAGRGVGEDIQDLNVQQSGLKAMDVQNYGYILSRGFSLFFSIRLLLHFSLFSPYLPFTQRTPQY
jgi:hypothetical protein